jgi:hypothetical protein
MGDPRLRGQPCQRLCIDDLCRGNPENTLCGGSYCYDCHGPTCGDSSLCDECIEAAYEAEMDFQASLQEKP